MSLNRVVNQFTIFVSICQLVEETTPIRFLDHLVQPYRWCIEVVEGFISTAWIEVLTDSVLQMSRD